jgi:hypothetical protein
MYTVCIARNSDITAGRWTWPEVEQFFVFPGVCQQLVSMSARELVQLVSCCFQQ